MILTVLQVAIDLLDGHLLALANTDLYRYMSQARGVKRTVVQEYCRHTWPRSLARTLPMHASQGHDVTMMAVLLGTSATRRGSMHPAIAKMLCLHIPALHPPTFTELELEARLQSKRGGLALGHLAQITHSTHRYPPSCRPLHFSAWGCCTRSRRTA